MPTLHEVIMDQDCELPDFYAWEEDPNEDFPDEDSYYYLCQMEDD